MPIVPLLGPGDQRPPLTINVVLAPTSIWCAR